MKKIGKKLSFLTKVLLVLGLIFSNLMPLSNVFADEVTDNFTAALNEDKDEIEIKYLADVDDADVINIKITENYIYLDNTTATSTYIDEDHSGSDVKSGVSLSSIMLNAVVFDGDYSATVTLRNTTDDNELLGIITISNKIVHEAGIEIVSLSDGSNPIVQDADTKIYSTASNTVIAKWKFLAGGLSPEVDYTYDGSIKSGIDLLSYEYEEPFNLANNLHGEHTLTINKEISDGETITPYTGSFSIMYGEYSDNDIESYADSLGISNRYVVGDNKKDSRLFVKPNLTDKYYLIDLYNIANSFLADLLPAASFKITTDEYADVYQAYLDYAADPLLDPTLLLTEEEFYEEIELKDGMILSVTCGDLTVTFTTVMRGDLNNDGLITNDDLQFILDQSVGKENVQLDKADLILTDGVNVKDANYFKNVLATSDWAFAGLDEGTVKARLDVKSSDITSGDTFDIDYVIITNEDAINGYEGLFDYDKTKLELVSIENKTLDWDNSNHNGKFIAVGDTELIGTEALNPTGAASEWTDVENVVLTATFKALMSGTSEVAISNYAYVHDQNNVSLNGNSITIDVTVNASDDNNLSSLEVANKTIALEEDVLDYEIEVENDVTLPNVLPVVANIAANIVSIVAPEQLSEGKNEVIITVRSEAGNDKIYKVIVVRKAKPKEEVVTQTTYEPEDTVIQQPSSAPSSSSTVEKTEEKDETLSRVIIIILILLVIGGLVFLIFKDDGDPDAKKANKDIDKLKKDDLPEKNKKVINTPKGDPRKNSNIKR